MDRERRVEASRLDRTDAEDLLVPINKALEAIERVGVELREVGFNTLTRLLCMNAIFGSLVLVWNHLLKSRFTAPSEAVAMRDIFADDLESAVCEEFIVRSASIVFCVFDVLTDTADPADIALGRVCCVSHGDWVGDSRIL